jgi:hypothetical protein
MSETDSLEPLHEILTYAHRLAASDNPMLQVAGERISVIVADVLYEVDPELDAVIPLLPPILRNSLKT